MTAARIVAIAVAALGLSGCIGETMGSAQPSLPSLQALRAGDIAPMRVGEFKLDSRLPSTTDKAVTIRSVSLAAPESGSFATYLQQTVEADLRSAGKLDPGSPLVISGLLTQSDVDSGIGTGGATLGARFTLTNAGKTVFEKTLSVRAQWDSSFVGAVAIPDAINQYSSLYGKLADALFADPDLKAAAHAK